MLNHLHVSITDVLGKRPGFKDSLDANLARGLNAQFGWFDTVGSGGGSCDTVTPGDDELLDDLAYAECNPVTSGLVKWVHLWPGFSVYGWRLALRRVANLPASRLVLRPRKLRQPRVHHPDAQRSGHLRWNSPTTSSSTS